jgi:hypothetical protein
MDGARCRSLLGREESAEIVAFGNVIDLARWKAEPVIFGLLLDWVIDAADELLTRTPTPASRAHAVYKSAWRKRAGAPDLDGLLRSEFENSSAPANYADPSGSPGSWIYAEFRRGTRPWRIRRALT